MSRSSFLAAIAVLIFSTLPLRAADLPPSPEFAEFVESYYKSLFEWDPTQATAAGIHDYDAKLADLSAANIQRRLETVKLLEARLATVRTIKNFSANDVFDATLLDQAIKAELLELTTVKDWKRNPVLYLAVPASSIDLIMKRTFAPAPDRLKSVIARLKALHRISFSFFSAMLEPTSKIRRRNARRPGRVHCGEGVLVGLAFRCTPIFHPPGPRPPRRGTKSYLPSSRRRTRAGNGGRSEASARFGSRAKPTFCQAKRRSTQLRPRDRRVFFLKNSPGSKPKKWPTYPSISCRCLRLAEAREPEEGQRSLHRRGGEDLTRSSGKPGRSAVREDHQQLPLTVGRRPVARHPRHHRTHPQVPGRKEHHFDSV